MTTKESLVELAHIQQKIYLIHGMKVLMSYDLAQLYGVEVRSLMQAVKRNIERFPKDFMFQLTQVEADALRSQNVILEISPGKHFKYLPYAFTQEGVAMLSSVLRSKRAIQANIAIMRTFVKLRELMNSHRDLAKKIDALENRYNAQFKVVFNSIREIIRAKPRKLVEQAKKTKTIGFGRD